MQQTITTFLHSKTSPKTMMNHLYDRSQLTIITNNNNKSKNTSNMSKKQEMTLLAPVLQVPSSVQTTSSLQLPFHLPDNPVSAQLTMSLSQESTRLLSFSKRDPSTEIP